LFAPLSATNGTKRTNSRISYVPRRTTRAAIGNSHRTA
jgi:hypothetical protein